MLKRLTKTLLPLQLLLLSVSAFAQIHVVVPILDSDSNPLEGVQLTFYDTGNTPVSWATSDANGDAFAASLPEGIYKVEISPSHSGCQGCSLLLDQTLEDVNVSTAAAGYDAQSGELTLPAVQLELSSTIARVLVVDQNNNPVPDLYLYAAKQQTFSGGAGGGGLGAGPGPFAEQDGPFFVSGQTDSNGIFAFAATEGNWSLNSMTGADYAAAYLDFTISGSLTQVTLTVKATDATIRFDVVDSSNSPIVIEQNQFAFIDCSTSDYSSFFFKDVFAQSNPIALTDLDLKVIGGTSTQPETYTCRLYSEGLGSSNIEVSIISGETKDAVMTALTADCSLTVRFKDTAGNPVMLNSSISAYTPYGSAVDHFASSFESNQDGSYELALIQGLEYELSHFPLPDNFQISGLSISESGNSYIPVDQFARVSTSSCPASYDFLMQEADVTLKITTDPYAWVDAVSDSNSSEVLQRAELTGPPSGIFVGAAADGNGLAVLKLASGNKYRVSAWPFFQPGSTTLPPAPISFEPESAGTYEFTMEPLTADVSLLLTPVFPEGVNADWIGCAAFSKTAFNYADATNGVAEIPLVSNQGPYTAECFAASDSDFYLGQTKYTPTGASTDSLNVEMTDFGSYYEPKSETRSATTQQQFTLQDGCSTVTFPANSVASSGNFTLTYGSKEGATPATDGIRPIGLMNFSVVTDSGQTVTEFSSPVTFVFCIDPDQYPADFDFSALTCVGSNDSGTGLQSIECSVQTSSEVQQRGFRKLGDVTTTFSTDQFSDYGLNRSESPTGDVAPDAPSQLKVKSKKLNNARTKAKKAVLSWPQVDDAVQYIISITKELKGKSSVKTRTINASSKDLQTKTLKLNKVGKYTFSVSAVSDSGKTSEAVQGNKAIKVK